VAVSQARDSGQHVRNESVKRVFDPRTIRFDRHVMRKGPEIDNLGHLPKQRVARRWMMEIRQRAGQARHGAADAAAAALGSGLAQLLALDPGDGPQDVPGTVGRPGPAIRIAAPDAPDTRYVQVWVGPLEMQQRLHLQVDHAWILVAIGDF
jgi:hypothetical protein